MSLDRRSTIIGLGGVVAGTLGLLATRNKLQAEPVVPQVRANLYNCEGCEAVRQHPAGNLSSVVQLAGQDEQGERMIIRGRALSADGARPTPNVIIYAHQTNAEGLYAGGTRETEWSFRHGKLRGWAKTDSTGAYEFHTIKPAPYPDRTIPAHVHFFIAEPGTPPYYLDDIVFDGEFGVTDEYRAAQEFRGGSGIVSLQRTGDGLLLVERDIRLERHPT